MTSSAQRYIVISTDGHCGADVRDYKPYLEARYHDEFEDWAASYRDGWAEVEAAADPDCRVGMASYEAPLNWESQRRLRLTEEQGVAAEVLFPNTSPPFYPSGALSAPAPTTAEEYEHRWAGVRAHNRWLVDFCADTPGRRGGIAQVFLYDIDDTIAEIAWAKEAGLQGVLLPAPHVQKMINLYYPAYDPVWEICQDLGMPVCIHDVLPTDSPEVGGWGAVLAGIFELQFYSRRQIGHLIAGGVFDRFPNLKVAATELKDGSVIPTWLIRLDAHVAGMTLHPKQFRWADMAARRIVKKPSDAYAAGVYLAGPMDLLESVMAGSPNLMFGMDLPHSEGSAPYTKEVLRLVLPHMSEDERRRYLSERAAEVYGFDLGFLRGVADRIGPVVEDVVTPLTAEELPRWPEDTQCVMLSGGLGGAASGPPPEGAALD